LKLRLQWRHGAIIDVIENRVIIMLAGLRLHIRFNENKLV